MNLYVILLILFSVSLSVTAQILLKHGISSIENANFMRYFVEVFLNPFFILGLSAYIVSLLVWILVLGKVDVSKAYPFVGLGFIGTMLAAHFLLGETITIIKLVGTLFIVLGVVFISYS
jgi:multidrug transporter EmrE-like cation transporter